MCCLFRFHQNGRSLEKSSKGVDFPLCFNLASFMTAPTPSAFELPFDATEESRHAGAKMADCWYHLYGIVSHGGGMGGGELHCRRKPRTRAVRACLVISRFSSLTDCFVLFRLLMSSGHYVSYMRKPPLVDACARDSLPSAHVCSACSADASDLNSHWFYASDSDVRAISVGEVQRVQAYILFYVRV